MTSRERLLAAAHTKAVDQRPTITWMADSPQAEAIVLQSSSTDFVEEGRAVLVDVPNPFGLALQKGIDINRALKDDPTVGADLLDALVHEIRQTISNSLMNGAEGIFYRLHGACSKHCSPMQYGGHFLERDRELLLSAASAPFIVLFVAGSQELYIDFVSDLPALVFAWDHEKTNLSASEVRTLRPGATASSDPASEINLLIGRDNYLENLEQPNIG